MNERFYSVDEISQMLTLHPKTVRRFIREGKITGKKIGREWKVAQADFIAYAHGELSEVAEQEQVYSAPKNRITVSAVVEFYEKESEEASRISNSLIAILNSKEPSWGNARYDLIYNPEDGKARFVLYGTPVFISEIMKIFSYIE